MAAVRDVIAEYLEELNVDEGYRAADELLGRIDNAVAIERGIDVGTELTTFAAGNDATALREVAEWLDAEHRVLIGLWSTDFDGPLRVYLQVVTEPDKPADG